MLHNDETDGNFEMQSSDVLVISPNKFTQKIRFQRRRCSFISFAFFNVREREGEKEKEQERERKSLVSRYKKKTVLLLTNINGTGKLLEKYH